MRNDKSMPSDWVSSPLTKWLVNNNVSLHQFTMGSKLSPNVIYTLVRGQTLNPMDKTIQKVCAFTGLSRRQFGHHVRAVKASRVDVDKSVVLASKRRAASDRMVSRMKKSDDKITIHATFTIEASDFPNAISRFLR